MTQRRILSSVLLISALSEMLVGCAVDDKVDPNGQGGGEGSDYAGEGGVPGDDMNMPGPDMEEEDVHVLPTYPTQHPRIYISANKARLTAALAANTPAAARFKETVDGWVAGRDIWEFRAWNGALMGALTGDSRYCTKAISVVDQFVASEEAKIASGTQPKVSENSYLYVGDLVGDLALTYDWCFDQVSASQKTRWLAYANTTLWNLWNPTQAKWGATARTWTGWSTNNPGNNYYYSFLRATMLVGLATKGETPQGDQWITKFRDEKVLGQLVPMFDKDLLGGGSREGTAYGVSHRFLFDIYDIWHATTGEKLQAKTKHARASMRTFMHQVMPTLDRFVNTGDQPRDAQALMFDYQRNYLQELVQMYPNDPVAPKAKALLEQSTVPQHARPEVLVYDFLYDMAAVTSQPMNGLNTSHHASGIGQVFARSSWDKDATWINFTAGAYAESHQHQDQGSLLIFKGQWLMADGGLGSRNGIIQDTTSHSLVRINSGGTVVKQQVNTESKMVAVHGGDNWLHMAGDVTAAYKGDPAVQKVQREVIYLKPNVVVVYDRVATAPGTTQTWQLATPTAPSISGATATIGGKLTVNRLVPASATSSAFNMVGLTGYVSGHRLDTTVAGGDQRYLHVLSLDGAVASSTAQGDNGVTIALADGTTATITFNRDDIGASLNWGSIVKDLGPTVDAL